ncbi:MAG: tetratricopeptide repeat-containing glycosyltransferase family protein [Acetobacteraceae bacterium]|nr:glycosyltransferase family protein [Pseudomonadota bacterium]
MTEATMALDSSDQGAVMVPVPARDVLLLAGEKEQAGQLAEAERLLGYLLSVTPNLPDALHLSGVVAFRLGRPAEALDKMERAISLAVDPSLYLRNICEVYRVMGRLDDALAAAERAAALRPSDPVCLHNLAVVHNERLEPEQAIAVAERALLMAPDLAGAHFAMAESLLILGRMERGWAEYEWRFRVPSGQNSMPKTGKPDWDGSAFSDAHLLLVADQGFGDVIQFARYIPWVAERCPNYAIACAAELVPVLRQLAPAERLFQRWEQCPSFRMICALSGLPRLHGTRLETIPAAVPYLRAEPARVAAWRERLDRLAPPGLARVGIVWAGRPTHANDRRRSVTLGQFAPVAAVPGVALVSLQKGPPTSQAGGYFGRAPLINIGAEVQDYDDTMALLECLDLVLTVDTSVAHLAAAMGKPVWIMLAYAPDWRWLLDRSDSPWYPTVRLFRQSVHSHWNDVFARVAAALRDWVAARR